MTVTVSQINRRLSLMVKNDAVLRNISVRGEISNLTIHSKTGHIFFTLRDEMASIKSVMFCSNAQKLTFLPEDGMNVTVICNVQLYERDGACQLYVSEIVNDEGIGSGKISFDMLKQKLLAEGLFDQKRPIPVQPGSVCVITSDTGAALQDILTVLSRRWPFVRVKLIPTTVQGENAPSSIVRALSLAQRTGCDLIIFGRGGGSAEDLSAFNDEAVARAVYASEIPTISAVGHEIDFSISDFVADCRAPTPSAAAELAVPDISVMLAALGDLLTIIRARAIEKARAAEFSVEAIFGKICRLAPESRIDSKEKAMISLTNQIRRSYEQIVSRKAEQYERTSSLIDALSPMRVLERGYAIAYHEDKLIVDSASVNVGDKIRIMFGKGEIAAEVYEKNEEQI